MGTMSWSIPFAPLTTETLSLGTVQDECVPQRHHSLEHLALLPHQQFSGLRGLLGPNERPGSTDASGVFSQGLTLKLQA